MTSEPKEANAETTKSANVTFLSLKQQQQAQGLKSPGRGQCSAQEVCSSVAKTSVSVPNGPIVLAVSPQGSPECY